MRTKRKYISYKMFDTYDICDITGSYECTFMVYKNNKYLGIAIFR